jgi:hypothetical protein
VFCICPILATEGDGTWIEPMREFPMRAFAAGDLLKAGRPEFLDKLSDFSRQEAIIPMPIKYGNVGSTRDKISRRHEKAGSLRAPGFSVLTCL